MESDRIVGAERATDGAKASQEARWADCSIEAKLERLRSVLRQVEEAQLYTGAIAGQAHQLVHDHMHDAAGRVMQLAGQDRRALASDGPVGFHRARRHSLLD